MNAKFYVKADDPARLHPSLAWAETRSPAHTDLACTWIQTCLAQHTCDYRKDRDFLPTRLVQIMGSNEDLSIRLHLSSRGDYGLDYCSLSHRWGGAKVLCLTSATLKAFEQDIIIGLVLRKGDAGFERIGLFSMICLCLNDCDITRRDEYLKIFDSVVFSYFVDCEEELIVFFDRVCRNKTGDSTQAGHVC